MQSCIYKGQLRHRRFAPVEHHFTYTLFMMYLDLDELDRVFAGSRLWSVGGRGLACFRRTDHYGHPATSLDESIRNLVAEKTGRKPAGPVRLLTHLAYFGYCFNPVSFFYLYDADDRLETIVAEVNNTPWKERHCYVLDHADNLGTDTLRQFSFDKKFHVSPFMDMNHR